MKKPKVKKHNILWVVNLAILLVILLIFTVQSCNPAASFKNSSAYSYNTNSSSTIVINPTPGFSIQENSEDVTKKANSSVAGSGLLYPLVLAFAGLFIVFNMVVGFGDKKHKD